MIEKKHTNNFPPQKGWGPVAAPHTGIPQSRLTPKPYFSSPRSPPPSGLDPPGWKNIFVPRWTPYKPFDWANAPASIFQMGGGFKAFIFLFFFILYFFITLTGWVASFSSSAY